MLQNEVPGGSYPPPLSKTTNMINEFFDIVVCLTQRERVDRQLMFEEECEKWGLQATYHYSFIDDNPHVSFCISQILMLKSFLKTELLKKIYY